MFRAVFHSLGVVKHWVSVLARPTGRRAGRKSPLRHPGNRQLQLLVEQLETRVTPAATVIASSYFDSAVYEFNATTGAVTGTLVAPNATGSLLSFPAGLAVGPDNNLYISSQGTPPNITPAVPGSILEYNLATSSLTTFISSTVLQGIANPGGGTTNLFAPAGLRFGPDGNLYVSENGGTGTSTGGAVVRFNVNNSNGTLTYAGTNTTIATGLVEPSGLTFGTAAGDTGNLYVSNPGNPYAGSIPGTDDVIKITNATSANPTSSVFVTAGSGGLNFPTGLAWGPDGNFYVVDLGATNSQGNVFQYSPTGSFNQIMTPTTTGAAGNLHTEFPSDILFDGQGHFLTANLGPTTPSAANPLAAGSIYQYNTNGTFSQILVNNSQSQFTGVGISPSEMALLPTTISVSLSNQSVPAFRPDGTAVGTLSSTEAGSGHTFTYSLVSGTGSTGNASFAISGNQLVTADALDPSVQSTYSVRVQSTDETGNSSQQTYTIVVTPNPSLVRNGQTLNVTGTSGNDTFFFTAATTQDQMNLNGTQLAIDKSEVNTINYLNNGGSDAVIFVGSGGDTATLLPTGVSISGTGYTVNAGGVVSATIRSSGSTSTANFALTSSGADVFKGTPTFSLAQGATYDNVVTGFAHVRGYAAGNTNAIAYLATSTNFDVFGGQPTYSFVQGPGDNYDSYAVGFAKVDGFAGGTASASYLGMPAAGGEFGGTPTYSFVQGSTFSIYAVGFNIVEAFAASANAVAVLGTSTTASDFYVGAYNYSQVQGSNYLIYAIGFADVQAYAGGSGQTANLQQFSASDPIANYNGSAESKGSGYDNYEFGFSNLNLSALNS